MRLFLHLCALLCVICPTLLVGAGVDVTIQVSVTNPPLLAPTTVTLPEGPLVNAVEAANGTPVIVGLASGSFVGESVVVTITAPDSVVRTVVHVLVPADLVAGTITVTAPAGWLSVEGLYQVSAAMRAPDLVTLSSSTSASFILDVTAPGRPSLRVPEGPVLSASAAADGTSVMVTLTSPTAVGDVVRLAIAGPSANTTLSATVTSADVALGQLTVQIAGPILAVPGQYSLTATVMDVAGNSSPASPSVSFTVEAIMLVTPVITSVIGNGLVVPDGSGTTDRQPRIQGTAPVGSSVKIFANGVAIGTSLAAGDGTWNLIPSRPLGFRWQTLTSVATVQGVSTVASVAYDIDILADDRAVDVSGCGAGGGIAVLFLFGAFAVLRGGFRFRNSLSMMALLALFSQGQIQATEKPDQIMTVSLNTWPAAYSSTATANGQTISDVDGGGLSLRTDATWRFRQRDDERSPWLGFSVSVWRVRSSLVSTAPNDATFQVRLTGVPIDFLEHFRVVSEYPWCVDIVPSLGAGPVLARIEGATVAGKYSYGSGTGYTLDAGVAVEPTYQIAPGWNIGAIVRLVAARTDVRFSDSTTGGASDSYHLTLVHLGGSAGVLVAMAW